MLLVVVTNQHYFGQFYNVTFYHTLNKNGLTLNYLPTNKQQSEAIFICSHAHKLGENIGSTESQHWRQRGGQEGGEGVVSSRQAAKGSGGVTLGYF